MGEVTEMLLEEVADADEHLTADIEDNAPTFHLGSFQVSIITFIISQVMKYREICIKYNQYLKKLYFHM